MELLESILIDEIAEALANIVPQRQDEPATGEGNQAHQDAEKSA